MVEFKIKLDNKVTEIINKHHLSKMKSLFTVVLIVFAFLGFMMLCVAYEDFQNNVESALSNLIFGIVLLIVGVCYYPLTKWFAKKYQNKIDSSMSILSSETEEVYKFDEDKLFIFVTKGEDYRSAVETNYKYINNIVETDEHYFLYISKIQCHVLNKKDLVSGSLEELNKIFEKHFSPDRFKKDMK